MRILVTGSNGLCGNAIKEESRGSDHIFHFATRKDADLTNRDAVRRLIYHSKPDCVIHTSAKCGGIGGNQAFHSDFFVDNILMNTNILEEAQSAGIEKVFAFSSVCVFPHDLSLLQEDKMHDGPVYGANFAYGYAKRMVDVQIRAIKEQYGLNYCSIIPGNIYGCNDLYSIEYGHIIPSLIHKLYRAKHYGEKFVVWGDGLSCREFIYVNDLAQIILKLVDIDDIPQRIIVSGKEEIPIRDVVNTLIRVSGYEGEVVWDKTKPNGQRNRPSDKSVLDGIVSHNYTTLEEGLQKSWDWFSSNFPNIRTKYT
jgi:GDP-L-fucose synthase